MAHPCHNCAHYHGQSYGHEVLHCGMHPYGPEGNECEDWEQGRHKGYQTYRCFGVPRVIVDEVTGLYLMVMGGD